MIVLERIIRTEEGSLALYISYNGGVTQKRENARSFVDKVQARDFAYSRALDLCGYIPAVYL